MYYETLEEDLSHLAAESDRATIQDYYYKSPVKPNILDPQIYQTYISSLDKELIQRIQHIYRLDFQVFDFEQL